MLKKPPTIKSNKIRNSARGEACALRLQGCEGNRSTVLCHLNSRFKGVGNKSPDIIAVYACYNCHQSLDKNRVPAEDRLRAWKETIMRMYEKGLIKIK